MLKGIGLLCLVLCGGICGFLAANRVRQKQEQLVHLAAFLHELEIRMWCHGGTLQELFQQLSEQETYQTFSFLSNTLIAMQQVSFTEAWKTSVQADKELSPDSQQMLCELGEELGISDLYTQKEILERYRSRVQQMEAEQRAERKSDCIRVWDCWQEWQWQFCSVEKKEEAKMDIDLIFKIAGTGIIVAVLNLVLKRAEREEQAMMTTLAGLIVVLVIIVQEIGGLFETVKSVFGL